MFSYATDPPRELKRFLVLGLFVDEIVVLAYLMKEWSVGEILIFEELKNVCNHHVCRKILASLVDRGLIRYVSGCCFNINADAVVRLLNLQNIIDVKRVGCELLRFLGKWYNVPI